MKKKMFSVLSFLLLVIITYAQQADDILGKYRLPNKLDVEIYKVDGKYFGKVIALNGWENGKTTDYKNPDKSKQNEPLLGKAIVKGLEYNQQEKQWVSGSMYGPEKGMFFDLKITEVRDREIEVVGSKYLFWRTLEWIKI